MSPPELLVRIASGRDAKDIAFATLFGPARMTSMSPNIVSRIPVVAHQDPVGMAGFNG